MASEDEQENTSESEESITLVTPSRKFSIVRLEKRVNASFSILTRIFTIALIIVGVVFIFRELTNDSYSIQQINVPADFESSGLSGVVVANLISDKLVEIFDRLRTEEEAAQYIKSSDQVDVSVDMVGLGVPVRSFIAFMGDALGFRQGKKINGDVLLSSGKVIMILRITGQKTESIEVEYAGNDLKGMSRLLVDEASRKILYYTNPVALELYYANIKHDGPNTVKMARYIMEKYADDPAMMRHAYDSWAWGLSYERKFDEAEKKIQEGLSKYPNDEKLYNAWGSVLSSMGKDEESILKYKQVFALSQTGLSEKRKVTIYNNIGSSFAYLGQYDSAMDYFLQARTIDINDWILDYNIACLYLFKKDTADFYDYFEMALEKGADVDMIKKDTDLTVMIQQKKAQELLKEYSER